MVNQMVCKCLFFVVSLTASVAVCAQNIITVSQGPAKNVSLEGKRALIVFHATSDDLVISTQLKDDPIPKAVASGGGYRYEVLVDLSKSNRRTFTVAKSGTTYSAKTENLVLEMNVQYAFQVEQVKSGIDMKADPNASLGFINGRPGEALVLFDSKIRLTVECDGYHPRPVVRSGRSTHGTFLDSLIVNVDVPEYQEMIAREARMRSEWKGLRERLDKEYYDLEDAELKKLEDEIRTLGDRLNDLSDRLDGIYRITVRGAGTNSLELDAASLKALRPKGMLRYNVLVLNETKVVHQSRFLDLIDQAESQRKSRNYRAAKESYESAAGEKEAAQENRQASLLEMAENMGRLADLKAKADGWSDRLFEMSRRREQVNKDRLVESIDGLIGIYESLATLSSDDWYAEQAQRLRGEKEKLTSSFVFKGRCVISQYRGGRLEESPVTNIRVYGSMASKSEDMEKRGYAGKGVLITTITDPDGHYSFTLRPGEYNTIIFEAVGNRDIKINKAVSVEGRSDDRNVKVRFPKN